MREKIQLEMSPMDMLILMSEGNPGAATVLGKIYEKLQEEALITILNLDDMGIRGHQVWLGYKDYAKMDLDVFIRAINMRSQGMVDLINKQSPSKFQAVTSGASFETNGSFNF